MTTIIRGYRAGDSEKFLMLVRELQIYELEMYDRMMSVADIGDWYIAALEKRCGEEDGAILVAEGDGELVGYATIFTRVEQKDEIDEIAFIYGYVSHIAVRAAARGTGIGKLLLQECEKRARTAGCKWLRLGVLANNATARRIYEHSGFHDHHVTMEKPLA